MHLHYCVSCLSAWWVAMILTYCRLDHPSDFYHHGAIISYCHLVLLVVIFVLVGLEKEKK
jgi:hypothetical protein